MSAARRSKREWLEQNEKFSESRSLGMFLKTPATPSRASALALTNNERDVPCLASTEWAHQRRVFRIRTQAIRRPEGMPCSPRSSEIKPFAS
jgi:hypothetical protein